MFAIYFYISLFLSHQKRALIAFVVRQKGFVYAYVFLTVYTFTTLLYTYPYDMCVWTTFITSISYFVDCLVVIDNYHNIDEYEI